MASGSNTKSHEETVLRKHYAQLISTLSRSINEVLRGLVTRGVIDITDKIKINECRNTSESRVEYLLDHYIDRSLAAGINHNIMELLNVMKEIPYCKPLAIKVEQDLTGASTVAEVIHDGGMKSVDQLTRQLHSLKRELHEQGKKHAKEIEELRKQGTKHTKEIEELRKQRPRGSHIASYTHDHMYAFILSKGVRTRGKGTQSLNLLTGGLVPVRIMLIKV